MKDFENCFNEKRIAECWYKADDYDAIKAAMWDKDTLPAAYPGWLAGAEHRERKVLESGGLPVRIAFDLNEFVQYCKDHGVAINAKARKNFATMKAKINN